MASTDTVYVGWFGPFRNGLFISAVTHAEMLLGARLLQAGKRRVALEHGLSTMFDAEFAGRILPFDSRAAPVYVDISQNAALWAARSRGSTPGSPPLPTASAPDWPRATPLTSSAAVSP